MNDKPAFRFPPTPEGWESAKQWAQAQPAPGASHHENLWEWALALSHESYEIISIINNQYASKKK